MGLRDETDREIAIHESRCVDRWESQERRFTAQCDSIMDEFKGIADGISMKMGTQLKQIQRTLNSFHEEMQASLQHQYDHLDERFNGIEKSMRDSAAEHHNARAIVMNGTLRRLHHKIVPIQVLRSYGNGESE